jgi:hypothetical protein
MKNLLLAVLLMPCLALPASAQLLGLQPLNDPNKGFKSAQDAMRLCAAEDNTKLLECLGFVEGASDQYVADRADAGLPPCFPADQAVNQTAIEQNFVAYVRAHPEVSDQQGAKVVRESIKARWCAK